MDKNYFLLELLENKVEENVLIEIYNKFAEVNLYEQIYTDVEVILGGCLFLDGWNRLADPRNFDVEADYFYYTSYGVESAASASDAIEDVFSMEELVEYLDRYGDKGLLKAYEEEIVEGFSDWAIKSLKNDNPNGVDIHVLKESYLDIIDYDDVLTKDWEDLLEEQIELYLEDQEEENE